MAYKWYLADTLTGEVVRPEPLPVVGSSEVNTDIHSEDDASIQVALPKLTSAERNDWKNTFHEMLKFCILDNPNVPWDAPGAILGGGFINKQTPRIAEGILELQLTGVYEYTKARIIGEQYGTTVTDPTKKVSFKAGSYQGLMNAAVSRMFSNANLPADGPKVPSILGNIGSSEGTTRTKDVLVTDAMTYGAFLDEISRYDSGVGIEYRFVLRWTSAARDKFVVDFITGTEQAPHINEETTVNLVLADNGENFSAWDTTIDSNDLYSGLFVQSKAGDDTKKSGADFQGALLPASKFPLLVERFFNPGVELTQAQMEAQKAARLDYGGKSKYTAGFTVELQESPVLWLSRLGCILNIEGVPDTISAGHDAELRCVGVSFDPDTETVSIEVMQKQPIYPRLPWKDPNDLFGNDDIVKGGGEKYTYNVQSTSAKTLSFSTTDNRTRTVAFQTTGGIDWVMGMTQDESPKTYTSEGNIGGGTVHATFYGDNDTFLSEGTWDLLDFGGGGAELPSTDWGVDGDEWDSSDLWGSEGRLPSSGSPEELKDPTFDELKWEDQAYAAFDGMYPVDVSTLFQDEGNRLYGLDRVNQIAATKIEGGVMTHWNGGINTGTGDFLEAIPPLYIKKGYISSNGTSGKFETIDTISSDKLKSLMAEYEQNDYFGNSYYKSGFLFSNWVVNSRYYLCVAHTVVHDDTGRSSSWDGITSLNYQNTKVSVISKAIDGKSGKLIGNWRDESAPHTGVFPLTNGIVRFGKVVLFTDNYTLLSVKIKNKSHGERRALNDAFAVEHKFETNAHTLLHQSLPAPSISSENDLFSSAFPFNRAGPEGLSRSNYNHINFWRNFEAETSTYEHFRSKGTSPYPNTEKASEDSASNVLASNQKIIIRDQAASVMAKNIPDDPQWGAGNSWQNATSGHLGFYAVAKGWAFYGQSYPAKILAVKISEMGTPNAAAEKDLTTTVAVNFPFLINNSLTPGNNGFVPVYQTYRMTNYTGYAVNGQIAYIQSGIRKVSRGFSFNGRIFAFSHADKGTLSIRSIRIREA